MPDDVSIRDYSRASTRGSTTELGRSARYLVRASATRLASPRAAACFEKYQYVSSIERSAKLLRGDLLVELIDVHGLRAIDIARRTGERPSDLSEMYAVSRVFPRGGRPSNAVFNHLLLATRVLKRFRQLALSPAEILDEIVRTGLTQHRVVTRHFDRLARESSAQKQGRLLLQPADVEDASLINRAHHARFQDLRPRFADRSIQILSIDPPYVFQREGGTYASRSASSLECDAGDDPGAAIGLVVDLLREWQPKLAVGGVVLLWQPWQSLLAPIASAAAAVGWAIMGPVIWDKGRPQPGRFDSPYSVQGEFLWVLHRAGDRLVDHDTGSRRMILHHSPASFPRATRNQLHAFEKPVALNEHLVRKHSRPGDLIVDACGCTGSMSLAAMNVGRSWVYIESNRANFELGAGRLAAACAAIPDEDRSARPASRDGSRPSGSANPKPSAGAQGAV